jgi:hypothetical protein
MKKLAILTMFAASCVVAWQIAGRAQSLTYNSGQDVAPAYEGYEENADGSFNLLFGYMNRNWQEELDVPVGPENNLEPGGPDQGQPTRFLPRRNRFVFRVHVPKDFGQKELTWTLTTHGKTTKAYASLKTDLRIENIDIMSETGSLGAGTSSPEVRANRPPVVKIEGEKKRTAKVGQPVTLSAIVTDDGIPKRRGFGAVRSGTGRADAAPNPAFTPPSRVTVGKTVGLHASWFVYRGAGTVAFTPDQVEVWEDTRTGANSPWGPGWAPPTVPADGRWTAQATFSEPGTYVIRCLADDGGLMGTEDLTVTVTR